MKNKLPDCQLVEVLRRKSEARTDVEFDYIKQLDDLRHKVGAEVRFINELFPEYTPHDEEYHLSRLFHVADTIIEQSRYEEMNATELFVLACGLYGHDWGMAVNNAEKEYIISGAPPEGSSKSEFALLHDEHAKCAKFMKDRNTTVEEKKCSEISVEDWRDYVRATHAFRSGDRIRHYFGNKDSGVGEAAGRVCEGHWLNIEDLENQRKYPLNFAVLRENLNLAAIAVYVRLVDLLDIGHDRTPYVIWKFVAPQDRYSKMEWDKHRALQPITCPPYQKGRVVMVDGSTDDHEVYAALEDLRNYCDKQIRECMNLLAQTGDTRHFLDLYHLDWRVNARGFDPVLIRFEFDRDRVFEILSDEIYQGDPYVFLRELLQNSVDAIRLRRELLQRAGIMAADYGLVHIEVEHKENGDARITCTDDGVGMDAHIVRNYLAMAGRSYYRSEEFQKQGLNLDPISRYGIGILSCFMVADLVEIETRRDPYAKGSGGPLRIKIPAVTRQFRVEQSATLDIEIGTRVVVNVEGRKLPADTGSLDVTRYMKAIAGFIEFPIVVSENGKHTVILHPNSSIDSITDARLNRFSDLEVHKLNLHYSWEDVFLPQDLNNAKAIFTEQSFDVQSDLGLTTVEGKLSFLVPGAAQSLEAQYDPQNISIEFQKVEDEERLGVRWAHGWSYWSSRRGKSLARSANAPTAYSIYRNGVLVPGASIEEESDRRVGLVVPRILLNILSADSFQPDIARVGFKKQSEHWFEPIKKALDIKLIEMLSRFQTQFESFELFVELGSFSLGFRLGESFFQKIDLSSIPFMVLRKKGLLDFIEWKELERGPVLICPTELNYEMSQLVKMKHSRGDYMGYLERWEGPDSIFLDARSNDLRIDRASSITRFILNSYYHPARINLLSPPLSNLPPLVQEVWERRTEHVRSINEIAEQALVEPSALTVLETNTLVENTIPYLTIRFVPFPSHSRTMYRVDSTFYNIRHPIVESVIRSVAWLFVTGNNKNHVAAGVLSDSVNRLLYGYSDAKKLSEAASKMFSIAPSLGLKLDYSVTSQIEVSELLDEPDQDYEDLAEGFDQPFGQILNE